jgi:hypothetical protein
MTIVGGAGLTKSVIARSAARATKEVCTRRREDAEEEVPQITLRFGLAVAMTKEERRGWPG